MDLPWSISQARILVFDIVFWLRGFFTFSKTSPLKIRPKTPSKENNRLNQPSIFRCELPVSFREGNSTRQPTLASPAVTLGSALASNLKKRYPPKNSRRVAKVGGFYFFGRFVDQSVDFFEFIFIICRLFILCFLKKKWCINKRKLKNKLGPASPSKSHQPWIVHQGSWSKPDETTLFCYQRWLSRKESHQWWKKMMEFLLGVPFWLHIVSASGQLAVWVVVWDSNRGTPGIQTTI